MSKGEKEEVAPEETDSPDPEAVIEVVPEFDVFLADVPGYLNLPPDDIRDEARRAWAIAQLTSSEGVLAPNWREEWPLIVKGLCDGPESLPSAKPRKPGIVKGGLNDS